MIEEVATKDLVITDNLIGKLIKEIYSKKAAANEIETFQRLYRKAIEKMINNQYQAVEAIDVTGDLNRIMSEIELLLGVETVKLLKPQTEELLTEAFKAGKALDGVPEKVRLTFNLVHQHAVDWMVEHDGFWIGKVFPNYIAPAFKDIIVHGMEEGLGRREIASQLKNLTFGYGDVPGKKELYVRVASASVNRARNWGSMFSLEEAGIDTMIWRAVGDERTCNRCAYLNGTEFSVPKLMRKVREALDSSPEAMEQIAPWPGYDPKVDDYYIRTSTGRSYFKDKPSGWLEDNGIGVPPLHPHCRCTTTIKVG